MLDLETMRSFIQVAETNSFSQAAKNLHKTSATISYRIKMLEESIGTSLFTRTTRTVALTPAGIHLFNQCKEWVIWLEQMPDELQQINNGIEREVKITVNNLLYNAQATSDLLMFLNQTFPFTQFQISRQVFMGVWDSIMHENYQLAIGAPGYEALTNSIDLIKLGKISWVFIASRNHPLLQYKDALNENILRKYPAINTEDTARNLNKRTAWLLRGQKQIIVPNMTTKLRCHLSGLGIGFLPRNICKKYLDNGDLVELHVHNQRAPSPMALAWDKTNSGYAVKKIIELFTNNDAIISRFLTNIDQEELVSK